MSMMSPIVLHEDSTWGPWKMLIKASTRSYSEPCSPASAWTMFTLFSFLCTWLQSDFWLWILHIFAVWWTGFFPHFMLWSAVYTAFFFRLWLSVSKRLVYRPSTDLIYGLWSQGSQLKCSVFWTVYMCLYKLEVQGFLLSRAQTVCRD